MKSKSKLTMKRNGESMINVPSKKTTPEKIDRENIERINPQTNEYEEVFDDETSAINRTAIEDFFMQKKTASERMNKPRLHRGRRDLQKELISDDISKSCESPNSGCLKCDLGQLRNFILAENQSIECTNLIDNIEDEDFCKWILYLSAGFNLLVHGFGSKRNILTKFCENKLKLMTWMRVDARKETASPKQVLDAINIKMNLQCCSKGLLTVDFARQICSKLNAFHKQLILVIDNIESADWKNEPEVLCALLENQETIKLIASVDHIYSDFVWNSRQAKSLNFLHVTINTFELPLKELLTGESRLLGLDAKAHQSCHSIASLDVFWKSLATNSKKLFKMFFEQYFSDKKPIKFWNLFDACRDEFIVSSDAALRTQLVEFKDHRIVKWTRSEDGNDQLTGIVDQKLIKDFLRTKGIEI